MSIFPKDGGAFVSPRNLGANFCREENACVGNVGAFLGMLSVGELFPSGAFPECARPGGKGIRAHPCPSVFFQDFAETGGQARRLPAREIHGSDESLRLGGRLRLSVAWFFFRARPQAAFRRMWLFLFRVSRGVQKLRETSLRKRNPPKSPQSLLKKGLKLKA
ncbi:hypothetical protein [Candidatus Spyradosoma sp. SGI.093]|uniref:hypothetical protein n=1 Tax=Candidatus Spyradosoma sp. SGI.093 TaxID=3420583 RepID=UPI003D043AB8